MSAFLELLRRFLALFLQIDDISLVQDIVFVSFVVLSQLSPTDTLFRSDALEGFSLSGREIIVVIEDVDRVQKSLCVDRLICATMFCHEFVVAFCLVIIMELVQFDNLYQFVGILRIGSIATLFQSSCPSFVIVAVQ